MEPALAGGTFKKEGFTEEMGAMGEALGLVVSLGLPVAVVFLWGDAYQRWVDRRRTLRRVAGATSAAGQHDHDGAKAGAQLRKRMSRA
jgi:hypothetical protein